MFNLSLTACSFYLKEMHSKGNGKVYNLNAALELKDDKGGCRHFSNAEELFISFFHCYGAMVKDDRREQSFKCEYVASSNKDTSDFKMLCLKIDSGIYGSSSDIVDGETQKVKYNKKASDIEIRPLYLMIILPKDNSKVVVQKGMFIFQNAGPFGVKTITTDLMREYFQKKFNLTLKCRTIAPELFINKVIKRENIKKLIMVKNLKSSDSADNIYQGYGAETREIKYLNFSDSKWEELMDKFRYVSGGRYNLFEFENEKYDNLKINVDVGGRNRTISLHNLENLSIIEGIPDEVRGEDGNARLELLVDYIQNVATEYLSEMVLQIS